MPPVDPLPSPFFGTLLRWPPSTGLPGGDPSIAAHLIARDLRLPGIPLLDWLADALDPAKETPWRLEFHRGRGNPRKNQVLLAEHEHYRRHYEVWGHPAPVTAATELLAKRRNGIAVESMKRNLTRERKGRA
jgi:hypothetical protein